MIDGYMVLKMHPLGEIQCKCARCTWRGFTSAVKEIKACELTPGDVSPIGRCPNCFELAYPDRETDRTQAFGAETKEALKAMVDLQLKLHLNVPPSY